MQMLARGAVLLQVPVPVDLVRVRERVEAVSTAGVEWAPVSVSA
jgi:hypothetical protein